MWRRALLAAAALSCTLPRHARAHLTPRLTQIQDLICVLIMSGMQKEDLDVSMLGKLQRYNVHLDDINNEQIRQQCASRNNSFTTDDQHRVKEDYISTTEYRPTIATKDPLPPVSLSLDTVIKYLKAHENSIKNLDEITTTKTTSTQEMVTRTTKQVENQPKIDMDLIRRYFQLETQKKSFYKIDDGSETAKHDTSIKLKTNERHSIVADDVKVIDKLIKDYLLKKQNIPTTTEYTTTRFDINNIYKRFDEIIANRTNIYNERGKTIANYPDKGQSNTNNKVNSPLEVTTVSQKRLYPAENVFFESFYNFLNKMNQYRNDSRPLFTSDETKRAKNIATTEKQFEINVNNQNGQKNYKESTTHKSKLETELDQKTLTPILVKEIAETVKRVIIKDLRNELAGIYTKTTQTTPQTTPTTIKTSTETFTTTSKGKTQGKDMVILDKFMDLYKEIKSLKQASFFMRAHNDSEIFINNVLQPKPTPVKSAMFMPPTNSQGMLISEPKILISSAGNYNIKPLLNYNPYVPREKVTYRLPITLQTNSVEIQPLAVPVSKAESLIRQNIIVDTGNHYQSRNYQKFGHFNPKARYSDSDQPPKQTNGTYPYSPLMRYGGYNSARYPVHNPQEPKQSDDVIRFRLRDHGNARLDTDYYEKINFGNNREGVGEKHNIFRNNYVPRFHERLERVDAGPNGTPVNSDTDAALKHESGADVPSRYQLSLVDMKKGTNYDDTHFKNFLKTQQKVTDMLEKILATRSKTNIPRSVEAV